MEWLGADWRLRRANLQRVHYFTYLRANRLLFLERRLIVVRVLVKNRFALL